MNKVCVIIVTFNGVKWIEKCLESIYNSSIDVDVVLVDNKSTDTTVDYIKNNYHKVHLIESNENLGFGGGNNLGIKYALNNLSSNYIFLLNQDAYLENNTIANLLVKSMSNEGYGILSPIHLNGNGSEYDAGFIKYVNKGMESFFFQNLIKNSPGKIHKVPFVNAAAWFLPVTTINKVGGFDPIFHHYGEDDNYCQRVKYHGLKIGIISNSKIYHDRVVKQPEVKHYSSVYYKLYERSLKTRWGNILVKSIDDYIKIEKKKFVIDLLNSIVRLRFKDMSGLLKKYKIFSKSVLEIKNSRSINKKVGLHYI